jgi:hypothetical protein
MGNYGPSKIIATIRESKRMRVVRESQGVNSAFLKPMFLFCSCFTPAQLPKFGLLSQLGRFSETRSGADPRAEHAKHLIGVLRMPGSVSTVSFRKAPQMAGRADLVSRRSVSRVLSAFAVRPFLWDWFCNRPHATNPGGGTGMFLLPMLP